MRIVDESTRGSLFPLLLYDEYFPVILQSFVLFWSIHILVDRVFPTSKDPTRSNLKVSRHIPALIHSVLSSIAAMYLLSKNELYASAPEQAWAYSPATALLASFSAGYLLYDLASISIFWKKGDSLFFIHHLTTGLVFTYGSMRPCFHYQGLIFLLYEMSTPFLNMRKLLWVYSLENSRFAKVNNLIFLLTFVVVRVIVGNYYSVVFARDYLLNYNSADAQLPNTFRWAVFIVNWIINALNMYWLYLMVKHIFKEKSQ